MQQLSQQMSPLSLVTGGARGLGAGLGGGLSLGNSLGLHHAAAQQAAHHGAHAMAHDLEQKMMEYMKLFQQQKEFRRPGKYINFNIIRFFYFKLYNFSIIIRF